MMVTTYPEPRDQRQRNRRVIGVETQVKLRV